MFVIAALTLLPNYGRKEPRFFFENATPELIAAGHPREEQLRTTLTKMERLLIVDYIKWHSATVSAIKEGRRAKGTVKTVIYKASGGLGDYLRGLLHAYFRCVFSKRLLLVEWDRYPLRKAFENQPGLNMTYDPIYFSPKVLPNGSYDEMHVGKENRSDLNYLSPAGTLWMRAKPSLSLKKALLWTKIFPRLSTSHKLREIFRLNKKPLGIEFYPLVFRALFRPTYELRRMMIESTKSRNSFSRLYQEKHSYKKIASMHEGYVSVHARLGHGINETGSRFDLEKNGHTMESVAECMATKALEKARETRIDAPRFYLATDTIEFREMFREALLRQDRRTKVIYGSWDVKHVSKLRITDNEDLVKCLNTFMDLYMMSKGKGMLQTKSGFSNLAVWMGGIRSTTTFYVKDCVA